MIVRSAPQPPQVLCINSILYTTADCLALGTFRSSPGENLYPECGLLSTTYRPSLLSLWFFAAKLYEFPLSSVLHATPTVSSVITSHLLLKPPYLLRMQILLKSTSFSPLNVNYLDRQYILPGSYFVHWYVRPCFLVKMCLCPLQPPFKVYCSSSSSFFNRTWLYTWIESICILVAQTLELDF